MQSRSRSAMIAAMLSEVVVEDLPVLGDFLALVFEGDRRRALEARGSCAVALPGGSVATEFFPRLATLDGSATDFFWGDERAVPADDPESNHAVARGLWLAPAGIQDARVHRMPADLD